MNNGISMVAPTGGDSKRVDNVELIPPGFQLCTLYSMCDIGTQEGGNYGPKHKLRLVFEFPQHYRVFYEGDDAKPASIFCTESFSMNKDSNLRKKFIQPMIAKILTEDEASKYDISQLLGKHYVATIVHSDDGQWANIASLTPLNESNMALFQLTSPTVAQVNKTCFYSLTQGYDNENFANLPNKVRDLIMGSAEGKAHKIAGGKFADRAQNTNSPSTNVAPVGAPPSSESPLVWLEVGTTYEQYKAAGWTDEQMITGGKAKKSEPVALPSIAPPPATIAAPPVTPPPPAVGTPPPPMAEKKLVFKEADAMPLEDWIKGGWTVEMIVEQGHATFQ